MKLDKRSTHFFPSSFLPVTFSKIMHVCRKCALSHWVHITMCPYIICLIYILPSSSSPSSSSSMRWCFSPFSLSLFSSLFSGKKCCHYYRPTPHSIRFFLVFAFFFLSNEYQQGSKPIIICIKDMFRKYITYISVTIYTYAINSKNHRQQHDFFLKRKRGKMSKKASRMGWSSTQKKREDHLSRLFFFWLHELALAKRLLFSIPCAK